MRVVESFSRDIARIIIWYPLRWLILIFPVKFDFLIFKILGDIAFVFQKSKRKHIFSQLSKYLTFTDNVRHRAFVKKYFENHFIDRLHIFLYPRLRSEKTRGIINLAGEDILKRTLTKGKGVILLHGHFGPIQLQLLELAKRGNNISQIGLLSDEDLSFVGKHVAFRLRSIYEKQIGAPIIQADGFLREAFKLLQDGKILMMTGDGAGAGRFIGKFSRVDFFGEKVPYPTGAYSLAAKTGAVILPVTIHRQKNDRYCVNIFEPLKENLDPKEKDFSENAQEFACFLEDKIRSYPCHWHFWDDFIPGKLIIEE